MSTNDDEAMATVLVILERAFPGALALPHDLAILDEITPLEEIPLDGHTLAECPYRPILEVWTAALRLLWNKKLVHDAKFREHDALLAEAAERILTLEIDHEDYAALRDAHDALQLEHADLEAAYFVLQRRASKEE